MYITLSTDFDSGCSKDTRGLHYTTYLTDLDFNPWVYWRQVRLIPLLSIIILTISCFQFIPGSLTIKWNNLIILDLLDLCAAKRWSFSVAACLPA